MARLPKDPARCSFCGKHRDQVSRLIAGPGVFICDRCVELCNEVLANSGPGPHPKSPGASARAHELPLLFRRWLRNVFRTAAPSAG
jgi:hypothetical protein